MELGLTLLALFGLGYAITKKPAAASSGTGAAGGTGLATQSGASSPTTTASPGLAGVLNSIASTVAAGAAAGAAIDKSINPNSTSGSQAAGAVAGGVAAAVTVAFAALGWLTGPLYPVIMFVVAATYIFIVVISDAIAFNYGQNGARKDYAAQRDKLLMSCKAKLATANPGATDTDIARMAIPYVDGYMKELNQLAFRKWMATGSAAPDFVDQLLVGRNNSQELWFYGFTRGKFIARYPAKLTNSGIGNLAVNSVPGFDGTENGRYWLDDPTSTDFPDEKLCPSFSPTWCNDYVPQASWAWRDPTSSEAIAAMGNNASLAKREGM